MSGLFKLAFGLVVLGVLVWWFMSENQAERSDIFDFEMSEAEKKEGKVDQNATTDTGITEQKNNASSEVFSRDETRSGNQVPEGLNNESDGIPLPPAQNDSEFNDLSPSEFVEQREKELQETISNYERILKNRRRE